MWRIPIPLPGVEGKWGSLKGVWTCLGVQGAGEGGWRLKAGGNFLRSTGNYFTGDLAEMGSRSLSGTWNAQLSLCLHNCTEKVRVCMQHNYEVNYTVDVHVRICFGAAAEAREVGAVCTGCIPAPLSSFSSLLQEHKHLFPSEAV